MPRFLLASVLAVLAAVRATAATPPAVSDPLPIDALRAGMTGEVWTVFKGNEPEPFAVQVTGVVRNALGPGKNLIVCELTDPRVQLMGAVAGMSGSPLYIDGRIAGVLSYQIQRFETVRYAGFTPIADMLEVSSLPAPPKDMSGPLPLPLQRDDGKSRTASTVPEWNPLRPVFSAGGLSPAVVSLMGSQLGELGLDVTALGGNSGSAPGDEVPQHQLRPGDAVAVALAVGDISLAGTGTVSHVDGKRILAFGHPLLRLGATELPMTTAEVVTILPSQFNSIKISNTGSVIGTFSQDRLSAVYGEIGRVPPLVPVEVSFPKRATKNSLHFSVVRHEQVLPAIAASGLAQALLGSNEAGLAAKGFRVTTAITFPGRTPIELSQLYAGPNGFTQGLAEFTRGLTQWLYNPFERVFPEHIEFRVEETEQIPIGTLENLQASRSLASPGDHVDISVVWRGFQQDAGTETVRVPIDPSWAGKQLEIVVANGRVLDEMTGRPRAIPIAQIRSFDEYIGALRGIRDTDGLYIAIVEDTALFTDQMQATADLPGSLERIARGADETRFQRRSAVTPLWEKQLVPGTLFNASLQRGLKITD